MLQLFDLLALALLPVAPFLVVIQAYGAQAGFRNAHPGHFIA
jgi:hypothetical protein